MQLIKYHIVLKLFNNSQSLFYDENGHFAILLTLVHFSSCRFFILPQTQAFLFLSLSLDPDPEGHAQSASLQAPGSPEGGILRAWQNPTVSVLALGRCTLPSLIQPLQL